MKTKVFFILLLSFFFPSCRQSKENEAGFNRIEAFFVYGATMMNLEINSDGDGYGVRSVKHPYEKSAFTFQLSESKLDSFNYLIDRVITEVKASDTLVSPCADGVNYSLTIHCNSELSFEGIMFCLEEDSIIDKMAAFLLDLEGEIEKTPLFKKYFDHKELQAKADSVIYGLK